MPSWANCRRSTSSSACSDRGCLRAGFRALSGTYSAHRSAASQVHPEYTGGCSNMAFFGKSGQFWVGAAIYRPAGKTKLLQKMKRQIRVFSCANPPFIIFDNSFILQPGDRPAQFEKGFPIYPGGAVIQTDPAGRAGFVAFAEEVLHFPVFLL